MKQFRLKWLTEQGQITNVSRIMEWANTGDRTAITNYYTLSNYQDLNNVNRNWSYKINSKKLNNNEVVVLTKTYLGSPHKTCDYCSDFTRAAGMSGEQIEQFDLKTLLEIKENNRFITKDGPFMVGPYISEHESHHGFRIHFDIAKN